MSYFCDHCNEHVDGDEDINAERSLLLCEICGHRLDPNHAVDLDEPDFDYMDDHLI